MSTETKVPPKQKKALASRLKEANELLVLLEDIEIDDEDSLETVTNLLLEYKEKAKEFEAQKKYITDPLNTVRNRVNELFNPTIHALQACIEICKAKILEYQAEEDDPKIYAPPTPLPKRLQKRSKLTWRVNYDRFNEIPRKYLNVDKSAVEIAFREKGIKLNIPGIEVYEDDSLAVYGGK